MLERLICALFGHRYTVERILSRYSRKVGCLRCSRAWAMNDDARAFVPWDEDFERLYRELPRLVKPGEASVVD